MSLIERTENSVMDSTNVLSSGVFSPSNSSNLTPSSGGTTKQLIEEKSVPLDTSNLYQLIQPVIQLHMQSLSQLLYQMNMLVLVAFAWLFLLTLAILFSFVTPWPLFLPSLVFAFILGYLSTQLHPHFSFTQSFKSTPQLTFTQIPHTTAHPTPIISNEVKESNNTDAHWPEDRISSTEKEEQTTVNLDEFDVPSEDSDFPPTETWESKLYPRMIEQSWVINEIKRQMMQKDGENPVKFKPWQFPSYSVNYPIGPLKIKGKSNNESTFINSFETPYFKGKVLLRFSGLDQEMDDGYFKGRKRYSQACIQGKFKYPYKFSEVLTGQIFKLGFNNLPPSWLLRLGFMIVKRLSPNMMVDITSDKPYVLSPLITAVQSIHIANDITNDEQFEGISPPDITQKEIPEDIGLLGGHFLWKNVSRHERKNFFRDINNLNNYSFDTQYIYTMDFYQHVFNPATYDFNCGVCNVDVSPYLNYQPIETMAVIDKKRFALVKDEEDLSEDEAEHKTQPIDDTPATANTETNSSTNNNSNSQNNPNTHNNSNTQNNLETHNNSNAQSNSNIHTEEENVCYLWRIQMGHSKLVDEKK